MILDTTSKTIEVILAGAITTNQLEITADWVDTANGSTFAPGGTSLVTNGGTAVTAVASPASNVQRQVKSIAIYNADTVNATVTVRLFDGTNRRRYISTTLAPGQSLVFAPEVGWSVFAGSALLVQAGTWTPSDSSGAGLSLTITHAAYLKIGSNVTITFDIGYPSTVNGSTAIMTGIPFQPSSVSFGFGGAPTTNTAFARVEPSSNNLLPLSVSGGLVTNAQMSLVTFVGSVTYISS